MSTIRRRIKSRLVEYKMESGRYLIREVEGPGSSTSTNSAASFTGDISQQFIQELKKAYGAILSEKEAMIIQLKGEIENLKKINSLLEREVDRLSAEPKSRSDLGLNEVDY